jgi:hypothetical protein
MAMKACELIDLLDQKSIVHPTWIDTITWSGSTLRMAVRGYPWWLPEKAGFGSAGAVLLVFEGLGIGRLHTDELQAEEPFDDEALEDFKISRVSDVPWAQAREWDIYCSAPIPRPFDLYCRVQSYLRENEAFVGPEFFLNQADDLSRFARMVASSGFLLCSGPNCIREMICDELVLQCVSHNVLRRSAEAPKLLVRLGDSAFLCDSAIAEFQS